MVIRKAERHRSFARYFEKLSAKQQFGFYAELERFAQEPRNPIFKLHKLSGDLNGFFAFIVGGDLRVFFEWASQDHVILYRIGSHNQVH